MKSMKRITFTCETVTPMFLTGADSRTPELRSPSIKGVMRFWWRAMNGHLSLRELKEKESRIFGGTGNFQQRSSFTVRVIPQSVSIGNYRLVPHKKFDSQAFSPGSLFDVTFTIEPTSDNHEEISLEKLKALFFITCYLGGFGKRVRRGMGSVNIIAIDNDIKKIPAKIDLNSILELLQNFSSHYKIQNNKIIFSHPDRKKLPEFGYITEIQIGKANPNYKNVLPANALSKSSGKRVIAMRHQLF